MALTRPSGLAIVQGEKAIVTEEISHVDARGRLNFLPRWRERVSWLSKPGDVEALMVFGEPGLVSIREWAPDGQRIQLRYQELAESGDTAALEALRLIQSRYGRLVVPAKERASLGDAALAHLGLPIERGQKSILYVAIFPGSIELLSPAWRNAKLLAWNALLDDLP